MIDPFYAFLGFVLIAALDVMAAMSWLKVYYRFGIPVFLQRLDGARRTLDLQALEAGFKSSPLNPSIRFRQLEPDLVALRETLLENRAGLRYLPIFHTSIRTTPDGLPEQMVGHLNGYVLAALAYLAYRGAADRSYIPVAVLIVFVLGMSYLGQRSVYQRVAKAIRGEAHG